MGLRKRGRGGGPVGEVGMWRDGVGGAATDIRRSRSASARSAGIDSAGGDGWEAGSECMATTGTGCGIISGRGRIGRGSCRGRGRFGELGIARGRS